MEKRKRWQFYLIFAVILLTIYNILPTLFYYAQPLKRPVSEKEATQVANQIATRVNSLEDFTVEWLQAESKNLGLNPTTVSIDKDNPRLAYVTFKTPKEASVFAKTLYKAGSLIAFTPAELSPDPRSFKDETTTVTVQRRIGVRLDPNNLGSTFHYIPKITPTGEISQEYRTLINDRATKLALGFGGESESHKLLTKVVTEKEGEGINDTIFHLARSIVEYENAFGDQSPITKRFYASFTLGKEKDGQRLISSFEERLESLNQELSGKISSLKTRENLDETDLQKLKTIESQQNIVKAASIIVKRNEALFASGKDPLTAGMVSKTLSTFNPQERVQYIDLGDRNPFVSRLEIDWNKDTLSLQLHPDVLKLREKNAGTEAEALQSEKLNQLLYNSMGAVARATDETIAPTVTHFTVTLNQLTNSSSLLVLDLNTIAKQQIATLQQMLKGSWTPQGELSHENYPIYDEASFRALNSDAQKLGLVFYAPMSESTGEGFRPGSLYVVAKGAASLMQKYQDIPEGAERAQFEKDFKALEGLLKQNGFIAYRGEQSGLSSAYKNDIIFELDDYASYLLAATRENFSLKGNKRFATLEFTDHEQRLLTLNKIETSMQEDLVKWRDEYHAAQVSTDPLMRYSVPPPTKSVFLNNMALSTRKYFRGDERKILRWGLDLSGGKTVRIGLKDKNNQPITDEDDVRQAINELYSRVNRLGVSEVGIRSEGSNIVLDFPGSQGLTAADLIKASAMYFHLVNEKFSPNNPLLSEAVSTFLDEVWNEAVITNRTDQESLNTIAWQHLGGDPEVPGEFHPLTSHAKLLYDNGLRLAGPKSGPRSNKFDDTLSQITLFRGKDFSEWQGQTNPLLIVFRNFALEGSNLTDIQVGYDPSEGNTLSFGVKSSGVSGGEKLNPQDDFYAWTSQFSEEKIAGTPKENFSQGRGWRMAVILNGTVISAPSLNAALKANARISGHFSQREINQLAADLKAGSLSFTPYILSEENVSPELGKEQRTQGIMAATLGIILVVAAMCIYYRFGGLVASVAVLFNLLILWGVLQNLGAALTLPAIAGIILSLGMAVDANVLVFERIREEFTATGRLASAIQTGYKKAFSAIVDSNLTTIIAALILLNFDSGPIKGFALTLIIGIVSSMFTSLFMTRYFFAGWVQNPKHKTLTMMRLFNETKINFLKYAKAAVIGSIAVILVGLFFLVSERSTIFGMDFTGGYAITVDLQEKPNTDYRNVAAKALGSAGALPSNFQIRELSKPNYLRIQLSKGMDLPGQPFHGMDKTAETKEQALFAYEMNPEIVWTVQALEKEGLKMNPASLPELHLHWTEMSGQLSETMRNQAIFGLVLALLAILVYITFRFEFKYAASATIGLAHDLLITLGLLALFHHFRSTVQIDLQVIAALVTIIGYSLNDTIIIFDRIREDLRLMRRLSFTEIVNHALNATLGRTMMTSGTTLLVLLALVFFGGASIFNFALIMFVGVVVGTLSSLFIAAPLLVYFHQRKNPAKVENTKVA